MLFENYFQYNDISIKVIGNSRGGFHISIWADGVEHAYLHELTFEEALECCMVGQKILGLPDERVLIDCRSIIESPDSSVKLDKAKSLVRRAISGL